MHSNISGTEDRTSIICRRPVDLKASEYEVEIEWQRGCHVDEVVRWAQQLERTRTCHDSDNHFDGEPSIADRVDVAELCTNITSHFRRRVFRGNRLHWYRPSRRRRSPDVARRVALLPPVDSLCVQCRWRTWIRLRQSQDSIRWIPATQTDRNTC